MNVRVESMCQGDGKIYVQVAIERLSPDAVVLLEAHLKDGTLIPSHLLSFDPLDGQSSANYAVIVPHLNEREIMLEFSEYRSADAPLGRAHLTIETSALNWRTRINSVVKNELIAQMFDIEREYYSDRMNVRFITAIDDEDDIVVKMLVDLPQTEGADVEVRFLDAHGLERDLPVYPLFEEVKPAPRFGDAPRVNVGFSVRVPRDDKDFCVSATDARDVVPGGFAMFCDESYEPLKALFEQETMNAGQDPTYDEWYLLHSATLADLADQRRLSFTYEPLITLIMPLSQGDDRFLPRTLRALAAQTYSNFEVVVVDRYFEDREFDAMFAGSKETAPITRVKIDDSQAFDAVFEAGLAQAQGEYCALLTPDIVLAPEALFEVVRCVNEARALPDGPQAHIIYAHHDSIHADGTLSNLVCKPVYSPDLLLSYNYVGPFIVFDRSLVQHVHAEQGLPAEALIYDLLFKAFEQAGDLMRIDQILYHIQEVAQPDPDEDKVRIEQQEEDFRGGRRAVANHLKRIGVEATVLSDIRDEVYRCNYVLPEKEPSVLVVIVNRDRPYLLETCLKSLFEKNAYQNLAVRIIDDGSALPETQECYGRLEGTYEDLEVVRPAERAGFAVYVNDVVAQTESDYILLLDSNVELASDDAIARMVGVCQRQEVGVVGAKLLYADDTIAQAGITVGSSLGSIGIGVDLPRGASGYMKRLCCTNDVSAVSKACQLIKRSVFDEVEGYDKRFKLDHADTDLCLKVIKAGYYVVYDPQVELYHFENTVQDENLPDARRIRLEQERAYLHFKWPRAFVEGDPFTSSLLARGNGYYQLYY
ncbi:glycosyltransferase family 2 protein [Anaerotardibacter muris]|uniref:glycosyltransferase family 2 protein n=1 Tax=Anaerotardibacter muris TaxID=2941505 RepID=UPI00203C0102|nr:glycosyltransferase [Anaerotardibacter muris]